MNRLFTIYFSLLNQTDIQYAITGRTENYPEQIHSDIDIIIPHNQYHLFWEFMRSIKQNQLHWIQTIAHESTAFFNIVTLSENGSHVILKPDVCSDYYRNGQLFLKADYLLKNRIYNQKGFFQLSPDKEFIYYLLKKIDKQYINEDQFMHLRDQWRQNKQGCDDTLVSFFSKKSQLIIANSIENKEFSFLNKNIEHLRQELHEHLKFSIRDYFERIKNRLSRFLKPTGLVIVFMGPDGCGKTTIINGIKSNISEIFRKNKQYHLYPKNGKENAEPVTNPHSQKPRGYIGSFIKLCYLLCLYVIGYWYKIFPQKIKSTFVIFDRYFHDLIVDPKRYRHKSGTGLLKFIAIFIPKPDIWILLDAPAEIIQQRKSEVSFEETKRQVTAYRHLFSNLKNSYIINANRSVDEIIYEVEDIIIRYLENRTQKRYTL
jgi:thymidylate kinase